MIPMVPKVEKENKGRSLVIAIAGTIQNQHA